MSKQPERPVRVRRTQASRSEATRARVLETTIRCLREHGYAATTTLLVASEGEVSRGAMRHHFPTKAELMAYVVQTTFEEEMAAYEARYSAIADPEQRVFAIPEIVWEVLSRPASVAVLEILQGSRSDPEMIARLSPLLADISKAARRRLAPLFEETDFTFVSSEMRLIVWAARGLSISQEIEPQLGDASASIAVLREMFEDRYRRAHAGEGMTP